MRSSSRRRAGASSCRWPGQASACGCRSPIRGRALRRNTCRTCSRRSAGPNAHSRAPERGLGAGLSIVRHIAQLHGGDVVATSARPRARDDGHGHAAGWLGHRRSGRQPAARGGHAGPGDARRPARARRRRRRDIAREPCRGPRNDGRAGVDRAVGHDALDAVERQAPNVVLSDLAMPDGDGFWLLDRIRHLPGSSGICPSSRSRPTPATPTGTA